ncbi:A/G-specific adenine DNA glycosylase [Thecamonas trahens ATCC 50062]|uniref:Adenine DNA glycosylase n=1 Tax=Thecamonas trahens ATCC 50062 TaxID=461836 RepID=A0A0L0DP53_THETB|nr:A/G-specific adenine DNA glycosylase [Thecamonas trahens ATCC 50062]KNC53816.1 A/G-specific adenine DNA glycosylase [Thecamonas trahens ATCC 50062]|eukprot:XP_013754372.1 A/G-specific adenine DNA glycosylase [Thecamonas trahens ATCC 50062]
MATHTASYHELSRESAGSIRESLLKWYTLNRRELPWRAPFWSAPEGTRADDVADVFAYHVWISEVMLQQTQVATVIAYFNKFVSTWPTLADLAAAQLDDVLAAWAGLGYYRRARLLHKGAQAVMGPEFGGVLPRDPVQLKKIPGIGPYTAGAISSIAFGCPAPIVDGNVVRVVARLRALGAMPSSPIFWEYATALVDPHRPGDLNQALMELGATVCTKANPSCGSCPIRDHCLARAEVSSTRAAAVNALGFTPLATQPKVANIRAESPDPATVAPKTKRAKLLDGSPRPSARSHVVIELDDESKPACELCFGWEEAGTPTASVTKYPRKKKKTKVRSEILAAAVIYRRRDDGAPLEILVEQRPPTGLLAGLWQLAAIPLDDIDAADNIAAVEAGLNAKLATMLNAPAAYVEPSTFARATVPVVRHRFSHIAQTIAVFVACTAAGDDPEALPATTRWLPLSNVSSAAVPTRLKKILKAAKSSLPSNRK